MAGNNTIKQESGRFSLPANLPVPQDDGACDHLKGLFLPSLFLPVTGKDPGRQKVARLNLRNRIFQKSILFFYPRTGKPDEQTPEGWDEIPGARGCTPQVCGFRQEFARFRELGYEVFGVSTQDSDYHSELINRLEVPFELLSDSAPELLHALHLPFFIFDSQVLYRRMVYIVENFQIVKVFYPVFPPDKSAETVLAWLTRRLCQNGEPIKDTGSLIVPHIITEMRSPFILTNDRNLLQVDHIWEMLKKAYWAASRRYEVVDRSMRFLECLCILDQSREGRPVGFARLVTDFTTFAYLCDVFVEEEYRGQGLSKWIMETIMAHPYLQNLRRFALVTRDAQTLYERYGFDRPFSDGYGYMEIYNPEI